MAEAVPSKNSMNKRKADGIATVYMCIKIKGFKWQQTQIETVTTSYKKDFQMFDYQSY